MWSWERNMLLYVEEIWGSTLGTNSKAKWKHGDPAIGKKYIQKHVIELKSAYLNLQKAVDDNWKCLWMWSLIDRVPAAEKEGSDMVLSNVENMF